MTKFVKSEKINLKDSGEYNEKWVQEIIAEDPSILGLGDLFLKDKERIQPRAGRLDLLLQDPELNKRYEVELQLGICDESHIIRTIEYWDLERKRFPQYEHCAVIIAENITSRFLNIIGLFNGAIPLIAIQLDALKIGDNITLSFTKVLDELSYGLDEDDEMDVTDRDYWTKRSTNNVVKMADVLLEQVNQIDPGNLLKYNKYYIGLSKNGGVNNFIIMKPKKKFIRFEPRIEVSEQVDMMLDEAGIDYDYAKRGKRYVIKLTEKELKSCGEIIEKLIMLALGKTDVSTVDE